MRILFFGAMIALSYALPSFAQNIGVKRLPFKSDLGTVHVQRGLHLTIDFGAKNIKTAIITPPNKYLIKSNGNLCQGSSCNGTSPTKLVIVPIADVPLPGSLSSPDGNAYLTVFTQDGDTYSLNVTSSFSKVPYGIVELFEPAIAATPAPTPAIAPAPKIQQLPRPQIIDVPILPPVAETSDSLPPAPKEQPIIALKDIPETKTPEHTNIQLSGAIRKGLYSPDGRGQWPYRSWEYLKVQTLISLLAKDPSITLSQASRISNVSQENVQTLLTLGGI